MSQKLDYVCEICYDVEGMDECLYPVLTGTLTVMNDGIGSYEYWGYNCYDEGTNYTELEELVWDEENFNKEQNLVIKEWLDVDANYDFVSERFDYALQEWVDDQLGDI